MKLVVDVQVKDLERAVDFYTNVLGLECRIKENEWAAISVGDAEIHLYIDGGITHSVEFYVKNIETKVSELKAAGVIPVSGMNKPDAIQFEDNGITQFPWGKIAYFNDSEGNELSLVEDVI